MSSKIIISIIFCLQFHFLFAQESNLPSLQVWIGTSTDFANEKQDSLLFIDADAMMFYAKADINPLVTNSKWIQLDIKKKAKDQARLKSIYTNRKPAQMSVIDSFIIETYIPSSGNFEMIISVLDEDSQLLTTQKKSFQLLRNKNQVIENEYEPILQNSGAVIDISKTFVAKYDMKQLQKNIAALAPIANGSEVKIAAEEGKGLDVELLKYFFYNFWLNRNEAQPEKAWIEYAEKLNEVAKKYATSNMLGFRTDRGRIFLKYGPPDKQERILNEQEALPYEIWFYYHAVGKGNVKFLFVQPGMMVNEMFLLHSNQQDEVNNPYWAQQLFTGANEADNKLKHKAYEYFPQTIK
jgi:GWxTD domain-containing protein